MTAGQVAGWARRIGPDPARAYIRAECTSGGNTEKFMASAKHPMNAQVYQSLVSARFRQGRVLDH
jgi:hypothetical protein